MSCYTRHLIGIMEEIGVEDTKENRKRLDKNVRKLLSREIDDCPFVWKDVKARTSDPIERERLIKGLRDSMQ